MRVTGPVYKRATDLMEAELGDELVALDPDAGDCFGFNSVATTVWRELKTQKSFEQLRDALLGQYAVSEDQCSAELREFLNDLTAKGLVVTAD